MKPGFLTLSKAVAASYFLHRLDVGLPGSRRGCSGLHRLLSYCSLTFLLDFVCRGVLLAFMCTTCVSLISEEARRGCWISWTGVTVLSHQVNAANQIWVLVKSSHRS